MNTPINWPYQRLSVLILPFTLLLGGGIASDTYPEIFVASMLQYFIRNKGCNIGRGKGKKSKEIFMQYPAHKSTSLLFHAMEAFLYNEFPFLQILRASSCPSSSLSEFYVSITFQRLRIPVIHHCTINPKNTLLVSPGEFLL